jgi:hypothetical protein
MHIRYISLQISFLVPYLFGFGTLNISIIKWT